MDHLYAPWRTEYISGAQQHKGCVFCEIAAHPERDRENHLLFRRSGLFGVMNRYPYTPGHFMIIPDLHCANLEELPEETWLAMCALARVGVKLLKEGFGAHGVNVGLNLGHAGGAGIAEHLHLHLVPRFERDTNFMTAIGETRVYSTDFEVVYEKIYKLWQKELA
ncbi:MAG: HIT domain-containing protein [Campylobacterales bacterium]